MNLRWLAWSGEADWRASPPTLGAEYWQRYAVEGDEEKWYHRTMIKALEEAIEKVKALSPERQAYAAEVLEQIVQAGDQVYRLSAEQRAAVREGLAELDAGGVVSETDMTTFWNRNRS